MRRRHLVRTGDELSNYMVISGTNDHQIAIDSKLLITLLNASTYEERNDGFKTLISSLADELGHVYTNICDSYNAFLWQNTNENVPMNGRGHEIGNSTGIRADAFQNTVNAYILLNSISL